MTSSLSFLLYAFLILPSFLQWIVATTIIGKGIFEVLHVPNKVRKGEWTEVLGSEECIIGVRHLKASPYPTIIILLALRFPIPTLQMRTQTQRDEATFPRSHSQWCWKPSPGRSEPTAQAHSILLHAHIPTRTWRENVFLKNTRSYNSDLRISRS